MALVNNCQKRLLLGFNILLGIVGVLVLLCALLGGTVKQDDPNSSIGLVMIGVIGVVAVLLSLMGVYGVNKENICMLKTCIGIMATGTVFFFYIGINTAISKAEVMENLREHLPRMMNEENLREDIMVLQAHRRCCGIVSYNDWGSEIPDTCKCPSFELNPSQCTEVKTTEDRSKWEISPVSDTVRIYREACGPLILETVDFTLKATFGVFVGLGFFTLIGIVLSCLTIHQIKNTQSSRFQETTCDNRFHLWRPVWRGIRPIWTFSYTGHP
uniref:Tetraspanin n=2 Tax=Esox lucius TaxID=8010 RepID=A0A3P8ZZD1_ESOLU